MFSFFKPSENEKLQNAIDYIHKVNPMHTTVVEKKKNYTWLIVLVSVLAVIGASYAIYKIFFEDSCCNYDDDFDDLDDDYEEVFYDLDEELEEPAIQKPESEYKAEYKAE